MTIEAVRRRLSAGETAADIARAALARIAQWDDPALFIAVREEAALLAEAAALPPGPLHGVPFVVKDNIDAAGLPTTAACPDHGYFPAEDAPVVARLRAAGALLLGKVNLDQFATGLNGTRSPHGTPRNAVDATLIPGGSSSGSASAVAAGIAAFSLGTDTAGSGRVPAAAQGLVGLKPSLGLVPTRGVVPACRSLDCVSVFAHTVADASAVLAVIAGPDARDPYSRAAPPHWRAVEPAPPRFRLAVPLDAQLELDDRAGFDATVARAEALGGTLHRVDIAPFLDVARRLYDGAWVAERTAALRGRVTQRPETLHPVTRKILEGGLHRLAVDAFDDFHAAAEARLLARRLFAGADALLLPTCPGVPTLAAMLADPIGANSRLGRYTNFVNLCDLAALAVPVGAGVTLVGPAFSEARLAGLGAALLGEALPEAPLAADEIALFCIGAHMSGLPLNHQVLGHGGRFLRAASTAPEYRLFDLGTRPGLLHAAQGGGAIAGEVWSLPAASIGPFLASIPPPLGFGRIALDDGESVLGFLAEAEGVAQAPEITASGGWRAHLAAR